MMIQIETEDNWYLSNSIMLDENGSNAYNYTSLDELFTDLFRFKFYPDTHTEISMSGSSFELSSAFDLTARKNEFLKKMKDSRCSINVRGENSTYTTLKLWQSCTKMILTH